MWTSRVCREGSVGAKLHSIDWTDGGTDDAVDGGWIALGTDSRNCSNVGISWIGNGRSDSNHGDGTNAPAALYKSHFNLKGHTGEVKFVRWRSTGDRLVSCDSWGNVKLWKSRASVLAVDFQFVTRVSVTDIQWTWCGYYIAFCGDDGFLQVFSGITGLNLYSVQVVSSAQFSSPARFSCIAWNKPSTRLSLGTEDGEVMGVDPISDSHRVQTMIVKHGVPVRSVHYYGPTSQQVIESEDAISMITSQSLSIYLADGEVCFFADETTLDCDSVMTTILDGCARWNTTDTILAVLGHTSACPNQLSARFINRDTNIIQSLDQILPQSPDTDSALNCITWGLRDSVLFVAHGSEVLALDVTHDVPSLAALSRHCVAQNVLGESRHLPLPQRERDLVASSRLSHIRPLFDNKEESDMLQQVQCPPHGGQHHLHCILVPADDSSDTYIMKYEYLGAYCPLLTAKRRRERFYKLCYDLRLAENNLTSKQVRERSVNEMWADLAYPMQRRHREGRLRRFLNRLRLGRRYVMDTASETDSSDSETHLHSDGLDIATPIPPLVAQVRGNKLLKKFKFFKSGHELGSIDIKTHYVKCQPRDISVTLHDDRLGSSLALKSKKPEWNERFGVFELDFGGRINCDSIKNFQIEHEGRIVFQFGKSSFGHFCLDFQGPLTPVSALCIALSCIV